MFRLLLTLIFLSVIQVIAVPFIFSTSKCYGHDNRGYQTSRNGETLTYDVDGHLQGITAQRQEQEKVSYAYDALGRRIKKSSYDDAGNLKESRVFIRNGDRLCEEYKSTDDVSYSVDRRYVYGSYVDELIYAIRGNRQELYYHSDRQYNVRVISDYNRRPVEYYHYTPYGERTIHSRWAGKNRASSAYGQNFGFTGRYHDMESDLYYFRARYYDAEQGRFISRDPAGYVDGSGLYNGYFAMGFAMDPSGMIEEAPKTSSTPPRNIHSGTETPIDHSKPLRDQTKPYNCHSHSWHCGKGDSSDSRNDGLPPRWDNNPSDDMADATKLGPKDTAKEGDVVVYGKDKNKDGKLDSDEIDHSAKVTKVDKDGRIVRVESKEGQSNITDHHPSDQNSAYGNDKEYYRKRKDKNCP